MSAPAEIRNGEPAGCSAPGARLPGRRWLRLRPWPRRPAPARREETRDPEALPAPPSNPLRVGPMARVEAARGLAERNAVGTRSESSARWSGERAGCEVSPAPPRGGLATVGVHGRTRHQADAPAPRAAARSRGAGRGRDPSCRPRAIAACSAASFASRSAARWIRSARSSTGGGTDATRRSWLGRRAFELTR